MTMWLSVVFLISIACGVSGLGVAGGGKVRLGSEAFLECIADAMEDVEMISPEGKVYTTTRGKGIKINIRSVKLENIGTWTCKARSMGAIVSATINLDLIPSGVTDVNPTTPKGTGPGSTAPTTRARASTIYFLCLLVIIAGIKGHTY